MTVFQKKIIDQDRTLSELIGEARIRKGVTVEEASRALHIQTHHLQALEDGHIDALPGEVYARRYLERYCLFLDIPAMEAREKLELLLKEGLWARTPREIKVKQGHLTPWPRLIRIGAATLLLFLLMGFFGVKLITLRRPPPLTVDYPPDGLATHLSEVVVSGITEPEARLAVNGIAVPVSEEGRFSLPLKLSQGINYIQVTVARRFGKVRHMELKVVGDAERVP